jgi:hypothetical protein
VTRAGWVVLEDHVRRWLPALQTSPKALETIAADLRPGSGGPWEGLPDDLEARRALLLHDVATAAAERYGQPWPLRNDLLPEPPDTVADIL